MSNKIKDTLSAIKWSEHRVMLGLKNRDKVFYVIRRNSKSVGLFSYVLTILGHIKVAEDKGYIPVVDMKNCVSPYLDTNNPQNVWEYYFEQPLGYNLKDVKGSKNVILSKGKEPKEFPDFPIFFDREQLEMWRFLFHKYIHLTDSVDTQITQLQERLFKQDRILGVLCRGTDYRELKPKNHPVQPEVDSVIEKVREALDTQNCDKVYLATEDEMILKQFKDAFGDKLIFPDFKLRPYDKNRLITVIEVERENDKYLKGLEYLTQIELLSRCNCFIGSGCGGSYAALLMSNGYEWQYLWNLGVYE